MPPVPPGGPSTVNGVLYQMLFSLLTLGGYRVVGHRLGEGRLEQVTLILEPSSGGDQQALYPGVRVVTQLKARSTGGSWSLQEIVRGVLPDLYRAVDPARPNTDYQFVTEGEQGRWAQVEEFFRNLPPTIPVGSCLEALDDTREIKVGRARATDGAADSFWGDGSYTARRLFRKVVDTLTRAGRGRGGSLRRDLPENLGTAPGVSVRGRSHARRAPRSTRSLVPRPDRTV